VSRSSSSITAVACGEAGTSDNKTKIEALHDAPRALSI